MIEHRNVVNLFSGMDACIGPEPGGTWLAVTSLSFDISVVEIFWTLARGFKVVISPGDDCSVLSAGVDSQDSNKPLDVAVRKSPGSGNLKPPITLREASGGTPGKDPDMFSIPQMIEFHNVTHFQCTPSMASMLMLDTASQVAFGQLKKFLIGGEAFPVALAEQLQEVVGGDIINMYGPTETTVWSTTYKVNHDRGSIPIGRPIANTSIHIVDDHLQPVPIGVPGELMIGGAGVVRGYLNRPELTADRFIRNPFSDDPQARLYRTGDLARYLADGNIEFLGRMDFQVKIRGYRIELGEIEAVLNDYPAVHESVAIAREDVPGQKKIVAYVVPRNGEHLSTKELRNYTKERLPDYMVPAHVVALQAFPQTPNKKIDRKALPPPGNNRPERGADFEPPCTEIEEAVAEIWAEALGVHEVGRNENFFDLGGDSLSACGIILSIRQTCSVDLPLKTLFCAPTIAAFADKLVEAFRVQMMTEPVGFQAQANRFIT
jgi:acyl-CoA synthetase (AMP-forming)/AMP-acid ligase II/acyl carrier protein